MVATYGPSAEVASTFTFAVAVWPAASVTVTVGV